MRNKIIGIIMIIAILLMSGCIQKHQRPLFVGEVNMTMPLNYTEVKNINWTSVRGELEKKGYYVRDKYSNAPNSYVLPASTNRNNTQIAIFYNESSYETQMKIFTWRGENDEEKRKEYIKTIGNQIAQICNLTLDWNKAEWSVSYHAD